MLSQASRDDDGRGDRRLPPHCSNADDVGRNEHRHRESQRELPRARTSHQQEGETHGTADKHVDQPAPDHPLRLLHLRVARGDHRGDGPNRIRLDKVLQQGPQNRRRDEDVDREADAREIPLSRAGHFTTTSRRSNPDEIRRPDSFGSLVRVGWVPLQPVHHARLGGAQGDPILRRLLKREKKRLSTAQGFFLQVFAALELDLEGELADERSVVAPHAPERNVRLGGDAPSEVEDPDVLEHLLDDRLPDELDLFARRGLDPLKRWKDAKESLHRGRVVFLDMAQRELDVVRVEQSRPSEPVLEWQGFRLELDPVIPEYLRPDIHFGGRLQARLAELEHNLGIARWKSVLVENAAPQDEGVVVEPVVRRVEKDDFANLQRRIQELPTREGDFVLGGGTTHDLGEVKQALARREVVRFQDELALQIPDLVERHAVGVLARLQLRYTRAGILRDRLLRLTIRFLRHFSLRYKDASTRVFASGR